ncbi:putative emopamil binding protein 2 [Elsinoe australis]|uniref:Putative emopamil binding protein 2 n=1 Tax=Elsinoe australis TaxID=40998 RepID=A0A4U7AMK6_9PEZI|nr:putative emopamil binding protein 2 [Elsinoe australis]
MSVIEEMASNLTKTAEMVVEHDYYPIGVQIAGLIANTYSVPYILGVFAAGCVVILTATYFIATTVRPRITTGELWALMWFVLSGSIHLFFEGYYATNQHHLGSLNTLFGQMWKEYAYSDSRYLTHNAFVLCMESITAFCWGPLCYCVAVMITVDHKLRFPLQLIVCLGQIYGLILYYATCYFDEHMLGLIYSRPEAYYYWGYYFGLNFIWMVIPGYLLYQSVRESGEAFRVAKAVQSGKKVN